MQKLTTEGSYSTYIIFGVIKVLVASRVIPESVSSDQTILLKQ